VKKLEDVKRQISEQGYVKLTQLFEPSLVCNLVNEVNDMTSWPDLPGRYWRYYEQDNLELLNRMENFFEYTRYCRQIIEHKSLLDILMVTMEDKPVLFKEKINFKLPGGSGFEYHQDQAAGWSEYAPIFWNVAIAVDECDEESGPIELAKHNETTRENLGDWKPLSEKALENLEFEAITMQSGDVVIFDSYVPHGSKPNLSGKPRKVMYLTYNQSQFGDLRSRYFSDKAQSYPQNCERRSDQSYVYRV